VKNNVNTLALLRLSEFNVGEMVTCRSDARSFRHQWLMSA